MRVIVIGATGTIGTAVADALATRHEIIRASCKGDVRVDIRVRRGAVVLDTAAYAGRCALRKE